MRVIRFYHSCSPSFFPSFLPPRQCSSPMFIANRIASLHRQSSWQAMDRSVHRWTSNGQLPTPVCTAGPQTASSRLQCAPLDLKNRMPERMPNRMPDRMPNRMPDRMPEDMADRMPEDMPEDMPDRMPTRMPEDMTCGNLLCAHGNVFTSP